MLKHAVGKSTLKEGFAVPRQLEDWIGAPPSGEKRQIVLVFDGQRVPATLRRLRNAYGHVQVRYDNVAAEPFRRWLADRFRCTLNKPCGEYLEVTRATPDQFEVNPFPVSPTPKPALAVLEWLFHRGAEDLFEKHSPMLEIPVVVRNVAFNPSEGQRYYNRALSSGFEAWEWAKERRAIPELPLKCDFTKNGVHVEVEFGNARSYYQDYVKFMLGYAQKTVAVGVLVVPTAQFARALCEIGRKNAVRKGRRSYSGMIHLGKVRRELRHLEFMLRMPLAVAGIGVAEQRAAG